MKSAFKLLALPLVVAAAHATAGDQPGLYLGAGVGQSTYDSLCSGLGGTGIDCEDEDTSLQLTAGYKLNPVIAIEVSWHDLGEGVLSQNYAAFPYSASEKATVNTEALRVDALFFANVSDTFALFGKVGLARADMEVKYTYSEAYYGSTYYSGSESDSDSSAPLVYGVGGSLNLNQLELRATYEIFKDVEYYSAKEDINNLSIQALMHF